MNRQEAESSKNTVSWIPIGERPAMIHLFEHLNSLFALKTFKGLLQPLYLDNIPTTLRSW